MRLNLLLLILLLSGCGESQPEPTYTVIDSNGNKFTSLTYSRWGSTSQVVKYHDAAGKLYTFRGTFTVVEE